MLVAWTVSSVVIVLATSTSGTTDTTSFRYATVVPAACACHICVFVRVGIVTDALNNKEGKAFHQTRRLCLEAQDTVKLQLNVKTREIASFKLFYFEKLNCVPRRILFKCGRALNPFIIFRIV